MVFPEIDPIAIAIGPIAIRWYALAYVAGILCGYWYIGWVNKRAPFFSKEALDDLIPYAVLGVILGGRLGYILFYNAPYYFSHPGEALEVWHGGMSFHGGLLGIFLSFYIFSRRHKISYRRVLDYLATATPIGLFFGRCANFINGELFGRVTDSPLGMVFPNGGPEPRYPSQLFEAACEGLLLFLLLFVLVKYTRAIWYSGAIGGTFLTGYGVSRFCIEFFREPDEQLGYLWFHLTMGQLLCLPMIALGLWGIFTARRRPVEAVA